MHLPQRLLYLIWLAALVAACARAPTAVPTLPTALPLSPTRTSSPTVTCSNTPVIKTLPPRSPTVDVAAIRTSAAGTVAAQLVSALTATALAFPTPEPPTETPLPRPTEPPAFDITLEGMRYEPWGRPVDGCSKGFDDNSMVRKFNVEVTLENHSRQGIRDWFPEFFADSGRLLITCFYVYGTGFPVVQPDEARTVTFASFAELDEYVAEVRFCLPDGTYRYCFAPKGVLIDCPQ
jgi:hypothetical protein